MTMVTLSLSQILCKVYRVTLYPPAPSIIVRKAVTPLPPPLGDLGDLGQSFVSLTNLGRDPLRSLGYLPGRWVAPTVEQRKYSARSTRADYFAECNHTSTVVFLVCGAARSSSCRGGMGVSSPRRLDIQQVALAEYGKILWLPGMPNIHEWYCITVVPFGDAQRKEG